MRKPLNFKVELARPFNWSAIFNWIVCCDCVAILSISPVRRTMSGQSKQQNEFQTSSFGSASHPLSCVRPFADSHLESDAPCLLAYHSLFNVRFCRKGPCAAHWAIIHRRNIVPLLCPHNLVY